eukprot:TRINITY_DN7762_c0_g1_i1.p1 TRINITY_DN7762_c0_g1~~TRINITY_DN7762_c0_g1_i1.p1  ORF type:complete len:574 (-),score=158.31 TRINITY_DN7762_c0_g1_i1:211-1932(-)
MKFEVDESQVIALVTSLVVLCAVLLSVLVSSWRRLRLLQESSAVLLFGVLIGIITWLLRVYPPYFTVPILKPSSLQDIFYVALLPPIIFNAGFTMKKRNFFRNIGSILTFAVVGTILCCVSFGLPLYLFGHYGLIPAAGDFIECMLFGALMSATDTVATLALYLQLNVDSRLYALVFGESVLNDAIAITLFRTFASFAESAQNVLSWATAGELCAIFAVISVGSVLLGALIGLASAYFFARFRGHLSPTYEMTLMVFAAYISYLLVDSLNLSGILALFVTSVMMSHYHWYSVSPTSRVSLYAASGAVAYIAETVTFISVGLTLFETENPFAKEAWDPAFIGISLALCFVSRAANVFPLALLLNLFRAHRIPFKHQLLMWFAGLRGAVALVLTLNLPTPHRTLITNTTYVAVLSTNLVIGTLTKPLLHCLRIKTGGSTPINLRVINASGNDEEHAMSDDDDSISVSVPSPAPEPRSCLHHYWHVFDRQYLKRWFGGKPDATVDDEAGLGDVGLLGAEVGQEHGGTAEASNDDGALPPPFSPGEWSGPSRDAVFAHGSIFTADSFGLPGESPFNL